jgi:transposase
MRRFVKQADRGQWPLLPECLDDFIDESSPVRVIAVFVDALDLAEMKLVEQLNFRRPIMDRPHRESRQRNRNMLRGLSQPTFAIKSAQIGR